MVYAWDSLVSGKSRKYHYFLKFFQMSQNQMQVILKDFLLIQILAENFDFLKFWWQKHIFKKLYIFSHLSFFNILIVGLLILCFLAFLNESLWFEMAATELLLSTLIQVYAKCIQYRKGSFLRTETLSFKESWRVLFSKSCQVSLKELKRINKVRCESDFKIF